MDIPIAVPEGLEFGVLSLTTYCFLDGYNQLVATLALDCEKGSQEYDVSHRDVLTTMAKIVLRPCFTQNESGIYIIRWPLAPPGQPHLFGVTYFQFQLATQAPQITESTSSVTPQQSVVVKF